MRLLALSLALVLAPLAARAGGLLLEEGTNTPTGPTELSLGVEIGGQVATTTVELTFPPTDGRRRFAFPVPGAASVVGFALRQGGDWEDASISREDATDPGDLDSGDGLDPVLREYLGDNAFVVSLPPASGEAVALRLTYVEVLPYADGEVTLRAPMLGTDLVDPANLMHFLARVRLEAWRPLRGFQSPAFVDVMTVETRRDDGVDLVFEASDMAPRGDFELRYAVEQEDLYVHLLTDHERCDEDGFFLLIVEPRQDVGESEIVPKYFTFVVDTSGSMDGYKMEQARQAAALSVSHLNAEDRFNLVLFSDGVHRVFPAPVTADERRRQDATQTIEELWASGGTNIRDAMLSALDAEFDRRFARIVVLLTDGQPTVGETWPENIVRDVREANRDASRVFTFGIGEDVNVELLQALAADNRGEARMIGAQDDISGILDDFFRRIQRPVMTDVSLDYGGAQVHDVLPDDVTDLFAGSQLLVVGRYSGALQTTGHLRGQIRGQEQTYDFPLDFPDCAEGANAFLPRLWAKAKIDDLLAHIALNGEDDETVAQIEALATRYGIQTKYTSYGFSPGLGEDDIGAGGGGPGSVPYGSPDYDSDPDEGGDYYGGDLETGGCQTASGPALWPFALLLLAVRRRR